MQKNGPLTNKILKEISALDNEDVIEFSELCKAHANSQKASEDINNPAISEDFDPLHALYVYAQNVMSVLIEQLAEIQCLSKLVNAFADADAEYIPQGPPISPLTMSYFFCWGTCDLCEGKAKESFASIMVSLLKKLDFNNEMITIFECMRDSRMGLYVHEECDGTYVLLRELITDKKLKVIVPSSYLGKKGEIWFARVLPEPFTESKFGYSVVFNTPYIVTNTTESDWLAFFDRNMKKTGEKENVPAYETLMKYGLARNFWNEYIIQGYDNFTYNMISLAGIPDLPSSLPHA